MIGDNVHVGHGAIIHCSKVGDDVLIGSNATLLDGAEVGKSCVIGANALVREGMEIPDGSFVVGVPAEIKGRVSPELVAMMESGNSEYALLAQKYKEQGL